MKKWFKSRVSDLKILVALKRKTISTILSKNASTAKSDVVQSVLFVRKQLFYRL
jgi:hypothetical protein